MLKLYCFIVILIVQQGRGEARCAVGCMCSGTIANCSQKGLSVIPSKTLYDFEVVKLDMSSNKLQSVDNEKLMGYSSLKILNLANNTIERIDPLAFNGLTQLSDLDISKNRISDIDRRTFVYTPQLKTLLLSENRIIDLEKHVFSSVRVLVYLDLSTNYLKVITDETFSHNPELEFISLKNNHIQQISDNAFRAQHKLSQLDLSNNRISIANCEIFKNLQALQWLSLAHNKLTTVPINMCHYNQKLMHLYLSNNNIKYINSGAFSDCTNLVYLSLAHNNIAKLYPHSLHGVFRLEVLDLSSNDIVSLSPEVFTDYRQQVTTLNASILCSKYSSLNYSLTHLNLENNKINSLDYCALQPLKHVEVLQLSRNHLSSLDSGLFNNLHNLKRIDISFNDFKTVEDRLLAVWIKRPDVVAEFAGNPWDCSCDTLYKSYKMLNDNSREKFTLVCSTPEEFQGQTWDILEEGCSPTTVKTSSTTAIFSRFPLIMHDAEIFDEKRMAIENANHMDYKMTIRLNETTQNQTMQIEKYEEEEPVKIRHLGNVIFLSGFACVVFMSIILIVIRTRYIKKPNVDHLWWEDTIARKTLFSES
ncbi:hypothetical protein C0J52_08357 [Blattella germanica]|nr:hypothetical protein C0J52_08357 [Blattella germanica]